MTQEQDGHRFPRHRGLTSGWSAGSTVLTVTGACMLLSGCGSHILQQYHVVSTDGVERNYYRVRIEGVARLSSSEFQVGLVDAQAIDQLLGEFSESFAGDGEPPAQSPARVEVLDPETGTPVGRDKKTVIVLASNPEVIFTQLKSLADTKAVSNAVTGIVLARERSEKRLVETQLNETATYSVLLTAELRDALSKLDAPNATTVVVLRELQAILSR